MLCILCRLSSIMSLVPVWGQPWSSMRWCRLNCNARTLVCGWWMMTYRMSLSERCVCICLAMLRCVGLWSRFLVFASTKAVATWIWLLWCYTRPYFRWWSRHQYLCSSVAIVRGFTCLWGKWRRILHVGFMWQLLGVHVCREWRNSSRSYLHWVGLWWQ